LATGGAEPYCRRQRLLGRSVPDSEWRASDQRASQRRAVGGARRYRAQYRRLRRRSRGLHHPLAGPPGQRVSLGPATQSQHRPDTEDRANRQDAHAPPPPDRVGDGWQQVDGRAGEEEPETRLEREGGTDVLARRQLTDRRGKL